MKQKNFKKMDKMEVFDLLEEVTQAIKVCECEQERAFLVRYKRAIRRYLYDCMFCAKARVSENISPKTGEETQRILSDCQKDKCQYHDYFYKQAQQGDEIDDALQKLLDSIG